MKRIEIVCHKGANEYAPENTYAAAQRCLEWGVDYVEVDVNLSRDGVHYLLHGPSVEETTNGQGRLQDLTAAEIDRLDAGSWFDPKFADEQVPRLEPFLRWIKGKAKVFFDVKAARLEELIRLVYALDMQAECFFWFGNDGDALRFRQLAPDLALKINVETVADVARAHATFQANLVEVRLKDVTQALIDACRTRGLRVMVYHPRKQPEAFRQILRWGVDLVNLDHADLFQRVATEYAAAEPLRVPDRPKAKRVLLCMLDGCRPDALAAARTPSIDRLRAEGAWTLQGCTVMPSITLPCHTSLFYSTAPAQHGVVTNDWTSPDDLAPSLIEVIGDAGYDTAAFYTWEQLRDLAPPGALEITVYRRFSDQGFDEVGRAAVEVIGRMRPTFAFFYQEATDALGHRYGWMSRPYLRGLERSDRFIQQLLETLERQGELDQTLCMVLADHGGHAHRHGTDAAEDLTIPWIVRGPGVRRDYCLTEPVSILDIAPTILYALGLPIPTAWQGRVVHELFEA
jgi:glycerophosphoryl diester phosphodiesterase